MPLNTDSRTNLVQMSTVMSLLSVAWNPAGRHASSSHSRRAERPPSSSPNISWSIAVWRMTPGSAMTADT